MTNPRPLLDPLQDARPVTTREIVVFCAVTLGILAVMVGALLWFWENW